MAYRHITNLVLVRRYAPMVGGIGDGKRVTVAYRAFNLEEAIIRARFERARGGLVWIERRGHAAFWTRR